MTASAPDPIAATTDQGDDLDHASCPCYPDVALCGADVSGLERAADDEEPDHPCVVCLDLAPQPCPKCGQ